MIRLSALTNNELAQVDDALLLIDEALDLLLERGVVDEDDGVDLIELSEAVVAEMTTRADEDGEYAVQKMMRRGTAAPVERPDGQIGYAPTS